MKGKPTEQYKKNTITKVKIIKRMNQNLIITTIITTTKIIVPIQTYNAIIRAEKEN